MIDFKPTSIGTAVVPVLIAATAFVLLQRWMAVVRRRAALKSIRNFGKPGDDIRPVLNEGYATNEPFRLTTDRSELVIIPPALFQQIKNSPALSLKEELESHFYSQHTFVGDTHTIVNAVKKHLMKNIDTAIGEVDRESTDALEDILPKSSEWENVHSMTATTKCVGRLTARTFVGEPLCRNLEWLRTTTIYTINAAKAAVALSHYPSPLRYIVRYFEPNTKGLPQFLADTRRMINPIVKERETARSIDPDYKPPNDTLQYIIENMVDGLDVAHNQLAVSFAAVLTVSITLSHVLLNLASRPALVEELRAELVEVDAQDKGPWTKQRISLLRKMDSVLKESQRLFPVSLVTCARVIMLDFKLPTGLTLPKGTHIGVATVCASSDPANFEDPLTFDGLRFYKMRQSKENENSFQYVTTGINGQLDFGLGNHTCPGRFYANYELKIMLAKILTQYDFKFPPGITTRLKDLNVGIISRPNPTASLMFRRRVVDA
ncbi:unnamed protein product [Discula destructiva]